MTVTEAIDILGPIRVGYRVPERDNDYKVYWLDGKPATKRQVIKAAQERQNKRRDIDQS